MKDRKYNEIDPSKFPHMPFFHSPSGGGELWICDNYYITFLERPLAYDESLYIRKGVKYTQTVDYLYSLHFLKGLIKNHIYQGRRYLLYHSSDVSTTYVVMAL